MEIRVLRYFLAVVREESISGAAKALHITQPTLSRQIGQMEEELGVRLFNREARKITLTDEGMLLRRRAEEILSLVDKTESEMAENEKGIEGKVMLGCGEIQAVQVLSKILSSFNRKYPNVTFDIFTATADLVKEHMDKGLVDVGLLLEPIDIEKYDFIRLPVKEKWVVLMKPGDPLCQKDFVTPGDLAKVPLIMPGRMKVQNELASWFGDYYKDLNIRFTSNLSTNSAVMVSEGLAYSVVVEGAVPFWDSSKITYRSLYPEVRATSLLAWKRQQPFSPAATKFIQHAKCFLSMDKA